MGLKNTAMKFFWTDEQEVQQEEYDRPRLIKSGRLNMLVRTPRSFAEVREYADSLMGGSAVVISFDAVDPALKNRIFDYLNGVSYIINASVTAISDDLLLYAPERVQVDKKAAKQSGGVCSWLGK